MEKEPQKISALLESSSKEDAEAGTMSAISPDDPSQEIADKVTQAVGFSIGLETLQREGADDLLQITQRAGEEVCRRMQNTGKGIDAKTLAQIIREAAKEYFQALINMVRNELQERLSAISTNSRQLGKAA